jgi:predicted TIM-barrel fold metal-dependent hydrolase
MHAHPPYDRTKTEPMIDAARAVGIQRLILCSLSYSSMEPYPELAEVRRGNEEVYRLIERHRKLVYGLVYVNPNHVEAPAVICEGLEREGVLGIKLWISCRDAEGRIDPVYPVLELAQERGVPVLIHTFDRSGGNLPGELGPGDIAHLARRYPRVRMIMAHFGGNWQRGLRVVRDCANVFSDCSGARAYNGCIEHAVTELGAQRVLFGSDAFLRAFAGQIAKVIGASIAEADKRRILWSNSAALFFGEGGA